jgi:hypothetical protein
VELVALFVVVVALILAAGFTAPRGSTINPERPAGRPSHQKFPADDG